MEQNWSARLRQGDEDALCEIIRQRTGYVSTILRNFSRSTLPPEDLEELSADVFLRLWRSRDKLKDGADLSPYLAAIARNCMKNYFRTQGKQPPVRQSYEDLLLSDKSDLCGDAETTEAIACLIRALDKLEEEVRELRAALEAGQAADAPHGIREELGDALFILCKIAQMSGVDPEDALHRACDKYQGRFRRVADAADRPLNTYTEAEKIALWEQAKEN